MIVAAAAFARPGAGAVNAATLTGAVLPDASLYGMVVWARWVEGVSFGQIFNVAYFSDSWQRVFAVDNSFILWGLLLAIAIWRKSTILIALCGAALLHIALDFPLHHDDGRPHFWPLTSWVFESPVSYWDPRAYGGLVGAVEVAVCALLLAVLWRRFSGRAARAFIGTTAAALLVPAVLWATLPV